VPGRGWGQAEPRAPAVAGEGVGKAGRGGEHHLGLLDGQPVSSWQRVTPWTPRGKPIRSSRAKLRISQQLLAAVLISRIPTTRIRRFRRRMRAGGSQSTRPSVWATFMRTRPVGLVNRGRQASNLFRSYSGAEIIASLMRATSGTGLARLSALKWALQLGEQAAGCRTGSVSLGQDHGQQLLLFLDPLERDVLLLDPGEHGLQVGGSGEDELPFEQLRAAERTSATTLV